MVVLARTQSWLTLRAGGLFLLAQHQLRQHPEPRFHRHEIWCKFYPTLTFVSRKSMKPNQAKRPLLIFFLLLLLFQGAAALAMGHHTAAQLLPPVSPMEAMGDCHSAAEDSGFQQHQRSDSQRYHDHITASSDCCSADGDCKTGHCSATPALAQLHLPVPPWNAVQSAFLSAPQVQAPVYPRFRPPILSA